MRSISLFMKDNLKKPASCAAAAKGKSKAQGKINTGYCVLWTTKGTCSREHACVMKHDPENSKNPKEKERVRDRPALHGGIP